MYGNDEFDFWLLSSWQYAYNSFAKKKKIVEKELKKFWVIQTLIDSHKTCFNALASSFFFWEIIIYLIIEA